LFLSLSGVEAIITVATTYHDLDLDVGGFFYGRIESYGEHSRTAGSRIVPGTSGEDWEGTNHFVGARVEEQGTVIGEDEEIGITGEVDKRVKVVLVNV